MSVYTLKERMTSYMKALVLFHNKQFINYTTIGLLCILSNCCYRFAFSWEFITIILPGLLTFTVLSDYITTVLFIQLTTVILFITPVVYRISVKQNTAQVLNQILSLPYPSSKIPFLSTSRSFLLIFTAIAILAVDFHIFPRRFAKTETFGTGLMDVGVGCFIVSHGTVSKEARCPSDYSSLPSLKQYGMSVYKCMKKIIPYVIIGLLRLATVKATDYQLHVSEYGVHWNFFFTIAVVCVSFN